MKPSKAHLKMVFHMAGIPFAKSCTIKVLQERLRSHLLDELEMLDEMLDNHEAHKNCYFWTNNGNSAQRRRLERQRAKANIWNWGGRDYVWTQTVQVSCRNYYYYSTITVDGERKDVRVMKHLKAALKARLEVTI